METNEIQQVKFRETFKDVLLQWHSVAPVDASRNQGLAVIDEISKLPARIVWRCDGEEVIAFAKELNEPINQIFLVNVEAVYYRNKPIFYLIKKISGVVRK